MMLDYMDYVQRQFEKSTDWNYDNSYANILENSRNILDFPVPNQFNFQLSNASTPYTFNTMEVFSGKIFNGSMTYLYTDAENMDKLVHDSNSISLQDVANTYRYVQPYYTRRNNSNGGNHLRSLYYGRMSYPSPNLEAMLIKRINETTQLTLQCVSSFNGFNVLTGYWQHDTGKNRHEIIISSNDLLCGYGYLHNFFGSSSKLKTSLYNNFSLSLGGELWLGIVTLSPGCSTTLRYCTHSPNTGRPQTLTLTWNPLFGHISSTYTAKTNSLSTFSTRYDFNLYSIESNLSFGCEIWHRGFQVSANQEKKNGIEPKPKDRTTYYQMKEAGVKNPKRPKYNSPQEQQLLEDLTVAFSSSLKKMDEEKSMIEQFESGISKSNFTSIWKLSTSLKDKNLRLLWEGKFKGFLVSTGTEFCKNNPRNEINEIASIENKIPFYSTKFGIRLQYST